MRHKTKSNFVFRILRVDGKIFNTIISYVKRLTRNRLDFFGIIFSANKCRSTMLAFNDHDSQNALYFVERIEILIPSKSVDYASGSWNATTGRCAAPGSWQKRKIRNAELDLSRHANRVCCSIHWNPPLARVRAHVSQQVLMKKCLHHYTMTCVKLDLVRLIDRLGTARAYQLVQGISLVRAVAASPSDGNQTTANGHHDHSQHHQNHGIPPEVVRSLVRGNESNDDLDGYLMEKVDAYLGSLSISVKLVDSSVVDHIRKLSSQMLANVLPTDLLETGNFCFYSLWIIDFFFYFPYN